MARKLNQDEVKELNDLGLYPGMIITHNTQLKNGKHKTDECWVLGPTDSWEIFNDPQRDTADFTIGAPSWAWLRHGGSVARPWNVPQTGKWCANLNDAELNLLRDACKNRGWLWDCTGRSPVALVTITKHVGSVVFVDAGEGEKPEDRISFGKMYDSLKLPPTEKKLKIAGHRVNMDDGGMSIGCYRVTRTEIDYMKASIDHGLTFGGHSAKFNDVDRVVVFDDGNTAKYEDIMEAITEFNKQYPAK